MKILIAHNRYQQPGGEDSVVAQEAAMLARQGHDVEQLIVDNDSISGIKAQIQAAAGSFYSSSSYHRTATLLNSFRPDILHVHNFVPTLSPSIFFAASAAHVPVVQTLHNYRLICANAQLFREGKPCEECLVRHSFLPGVQHACYRGSRLGSAVIGGGMLVHDLLGTWARRIDRYIVLTKFAAGKLGENRIPPDKIRLKPNFVPDQGVGTGEGGFALFVGRLSDEKGIATLLEADRTGQLAMPVKIAGDGPLLNQVQTACQRSGSRLTSLGRKSAQEIQKLMKEAAVLLVPSVWYEGFPMVMVEALSYGLPILASRIGGLAEIIEDGSSGLLFEPGNPHSLLEAVRRFASQPQRTPAMRDAARGKYLSSYTENKNYEQLLGIYGELIASKNTPAISSTD